MIKKLLAISSLLLITACSKVPAGHVGVKVYLLGGDKGVSSEELPVGRYWIGMNEELYLFPTFAQNAVWTLEETPESPTDQSFSFQTVEGMSVSADIGITYSIQPDKVTGIYEKYRKGVDEITDIYLRNMVRDALVKVTSTQKIESVYGAGKATIIESVEKMVRDQVKTIGINVERIYWIGNLRLPTQVTAAINAKIEATQKTQQRENEVAQSKAEADKAIEEARGIADSKLLVAKAEAEAIELKGKAIRENPSVIELNAIDKWDGKLPTYSGGGAVPFINIDKK